MAKNFYEILGVSQWASDEELKAAIEQITLELGGAEDHASREALQLARKAYATLSDPRLRAQYDRRLGQRANANPSPTRSLAWPRLRLRHFPPPQDCGLSPPPPASTPPASRNPFVIVIALLALILFWGIQKENTRRAEAQLASSEKTMAAALAEKDKALAQLQSELARQQKEMEDKRLELENRRMELENKKIETERKSIEASQDAAYKRIDSDTSISNRGLDLEEPIARAEAGKRQAEIGQTQAQTQVLREQARFIELDNRKKQFDYDRRVQAERIDILRETALLNKYREQELNGGDRLTRSNPGLGR